MRARLIAALLAAVLAIVGTMILVTYVRNVEQRVLEGHRTVHVLVVQDDIEEGTSVEDLADRVAFEETIARLVADGAVTDLDDVEGLVTSTDLVAGEQLLRSRFVDPDELDPTDRLDVPEDLHQVTIPLDAHRAVGGVLLPGDTVGVFASMTASPDDDLGDVTHLILHKVLVTRVQFEQSASDDREQFERSVPGGRILVTLATNAGDAERIVFAAEHGTLWLSQEPDVAPETGTTLRDRESIFR